MTEQELSYWAGIFDAKAYISTRKVSGRNHVTPYFVLKSKDKEFLELAAKAFDGNVRAAKQSSNPAYSTIYIWERTANSAREIILKLAPYMKRNKEIVKEVIAWRTQSGKRYLPAVFPLVAVRINGRAMSGSE